MRAGSGIARNFISQSRSTFADAAVKPWMESPSGAAEGTTSSNEGSTNARKIWFIDGGGWRGVVSRRMHCLTAEREGQSIGPFHVPLRTQTRAEIADFADKTILWCCCLCVFFSAVCARLRFQLDMQ